MRSMPSYVNKVGGWALDISKALWPGVLEDDSKFTDLNTRVLKEVQFPCVIFAQYDFGIVAIDCNDCDTYEVDDPRITVYIKLQYNPNHNYKQKVYPFTFVPQTALFASELGDHRTKYSNTIKIYPAWGRFIAVSLDRYRLSHTMGKLGIPGGAYVLTENGYEDHYLDPIKPRQRMDFNEYMSHMYKSMAVIDARGFGDFTHRTIEALAIGIPLIRPKFTNMMADPLIAGIHYLDCGPSGERLKECVEMVQNRYVRRCLIDAGQAWYEKNCTPKALQHILDTTIGSHFTTPPIPMIDSIPNPRPVVDPKFDLLIGLYKDKSDERMKELIQCLEFNIADNMIEKVHVFWEDPTSLEEAVKIVPPLKHKKVNLIWHGRRLFFCDLFKYANANLERVIVSNNDIYFGNLDRLAQYDLKGRILCMTRWDVSKYEIPRYMNCDASQDSWIFQTPINLDPQFHLGWWGCDGRINKLSIEAGLLVSNPSFEIFAYHNHHSGVRNYDSKKDFVPDGCGIPPSKLVWSENVTSTRVAPSASVELHVSVPSQLNTLIDGMSSHNNVYRRITHVPPELYKLQYTMVKAFHSAPINIKCLKAGVVYVLVGRDWDGGIKGPLQGFGATLTNLVVETVNTKYDAWSLPMTVGQEITLPVQVLIACESLSQVPVASRI